MNLWQKLQGLLARGWRAASGDQTGGPTAYFTRSSNWVPVSSSNLHSVAYYVDLRRGGTGNVLGVRFLDKHSGGVGSEYHYQNVRPSEAAALLSAPSKGHNLHVAVKLTGKPYKRVR